MSLNRKGKIVKINGQYITVIVLKSDSERELGEATLPAATTHLLDIAVNFIGEKVTFATKDGKISEIGSVF
jgi:hypothetical protein